MQKELRDEMDAKVTELTEVCDKLKLEHA